MFSHHLRAQSAQSKIKNTTANLCLLVIESFYGTQLFGARRFSFSLDLEYVVFFPTTRRSWNMEGVRGAAFLYHDVA